MKRCYPSFVALLKVFRNYCRCPAQALRLGGHGGKISGDYPTSFAHVTLGSRPAPYQFPRL